MSEKATLEIDVEKLKANGQSEAESKKRLRDENDDLLNKIERYFLKAWVFSILMNFFMF